MNRLTNSLLLVLSCASIFGQSAAVNPATTRLKVHADAATRENLLQRDRLPRGARSHVVVQFDQPPTADVLDALRARGAVVLQDVPDNAVLVAIDGTVALDDLGIRSAARLNPQEKISPMIVNGAASAASGYFLVEFHPDVDLNAARRMILCAGLELTENPDLASHHLMVHVADTAHVSEAIATLTTLDPVAYVFPASEDLIRRRRAIAYDDAMTTLGPVAQYIATSGDGWDGPGQNATTLNYVFSQMTAQLAVRRDAS